jgi:hypothetical protein
MSIKATNWAWEQDMRPTEKLVLMAICDCHNASTGKCDPTFDYIAKKAGVSRITAVRIVQKLVGQQYLSTLNAKSQDGRQLPNTYLLHIDTTEYQSDTPSTVSRVSFNDEPSIIFDDAEYHSCDTHIKNRKEEPERKNKQKEISSFDDFYSKYPNKVGRSQAHKSFEKLSVQDQQAAISALPAFNDWVSKQFKGYASPHPSTYLNQRRFDDFKADPIDWEKRLVMARNNKIWDYKTWGPMPRQTGCTVPAGLLQASDGVGWSMWESRSYKAA